MTDQPGGPMNFNPEDPSPWTSLDDIEREAKAIVPRSMEQMREHYLNQVEPQIVEGRILRPGDPSPGRNQSRVPPSPESKRLMLTPLEGRPIRGGVHSAFALDGPAAGEWRTQESPWRAMEMEDHLHDAMRYGRMMDGSPYADEAITYKQTVYSLQRLAIQGDTRRQYFFWSSLPVWEMDPAAAVFLLIDAEPWQTALCRVPDPTTMPRY